MRGRWTVVGLGCVALAIAALGGCGGSDDPSDDAAGETSEATAEGNDADAGDDSGTDDGDDTNGSAPETVGDDATTSDDADSSDGTTQETGDGDGDGGDDGDDGDGGDGDAAGDGEYPCDDIFSMADVEAWFGEPAELTEDRMDSIGQIVCTWETIEDPTNTDDLAFQLITAQIFTGEGVPAESFVDPEIFEDVTPIDGVGDLAFSTEDLGQTYYFLDDGIAGVMSVSEVDMGAVDAPKRHTAEEVDGLFRQFHARVTG